MKILIRTGNGKEYIEVTEFESVRELSEHSRFIIDCYSSRTPPVDGAPVLSWDDIVSHFGSIMDIDTNRKRLLKVEGISETFKTVLRSNRVTLFVKALQEYDGNLYSNLGS